MGLNNRLDVVIVSPQSQDELDALSKEGISRQKLSIFTSVNSAVITRFSPHQKIAMARVQNGRITRQSEGGVPADSFFQ